MIDPFYCNVDFPVFTSDVNNEQKQRQGNNYDGKKTFALITPEYIKSSKKAFSGMAYIWQAFQWMAIIASQHGQYECVLGF